MSTGNTLLSLGVAAGALGGGVYLYRNARSGDVQAVALDGVYAALGNVTAMLSDLIGNTPSGPGPTQSAGVTVPGAAVVYADVPVANAPGLVLTGAPVPNPTTWDPTPHAGTADQPQPQTMDQALAQARATGTPIAPPGVTDPASLWALIRAGLGM